MNDLRAAVKEAKVARRPIVDEDYERPEWREASISPRSANGTIVQLAQTDLDLEGRERLWRPTPCRIEQRGGA